MPIDRSTVDLSEHPDLVVVYLGMRVNTWGGIRTLLKFIWKVGLAIRAQPEGLLHYETFVFSVRQIGLRWYWSDFQTLENWTRSSPHKDWWQSFLHDQGGTGFWHELYYVQGGMEAVYINMKVPVGFMQFGEVMPARGPLFTARKRLRLSGEPEVAVPVTEEEVYSSAAASSQERSIP